MATVETPPRALATSKPDQIHSQDRFHDLGLLDVWGVVRRRWMLVLAGVVVGWVLAGAYFVTAPSTYESSSQLLVMRKDPKLAVSGIEGSRDVSQSGIGEAMLATQMQILQSPLIVGEALSANGLDKLDSIVQQLGEAKSPADFVIDRLTVSRGGEGLARDADVLSIAFRHSSDVESQQILNAIIVRYQAFLDEQFRDVNEEAAALIVDARTELASELAAAEQAYQKFRESAPIMWADGEGVTNVHLQRFDELQNELSLIGIQVNEVESRLNVAEQVIADQNETGANDLERLAIIDEKNAARVEIMVAAQQSESQTAAFQSRQPERAAFAEGEYSALLELRMKEQELLLNFAPRHPAVEAVRKRIEIAERLMQEREGELKVADNDLLDSKNLQQSYLSLLRRDLETLRQREAELQRLAGDEETEAKALVKYELQGETLSQEVTRQQNLYDAVVDRLRQINLGKDYGGIINEVIAPAKVGEEVWPSLPICLALGTMLGLVFGGGGTLVSELRDRSFRNVDEVKQALRLSVLTQVPNIDVGKDRDLVSAIQQSQSTIDPILYTVHLPRSPLAEIFRGLRTSVFFRGHNMDLKTIAITSPKQGDGKTTVLGNLAVSIANSGQSVLIVDADMRRPRIAKAFAAAEGAGLSSVVRDATIEPWDLVQSTPVENLWLLPCGEVPENPAELLNSRRFAEFLATARERYNYILVDCPPVLAVTDPRIVARLVDGVILVVRLDKDTRHEVVHAKELLEESKAELLGTVVNCGNAGQRDGYSYGYQQGYEAG